MASAAFSSIRMDWKARPTRERSKRPKKKTTRRTITSRMEKTVRLMNSLFLRPKLSGEKPYFCTWARIVRPRWGIPATPTAPLVKDSQLMKITRTTSPKPRVAMAR